MIIHGESNTQDRKPLTLGTCHEFIQDEVLHSATSNPEGRTSATFRTSHNRPMGAKHPSFTRHGWKEIRAMAIVQSQAVYTLYTTTNPITSNTSHQASVTNMMQLGPPCWAKCQLCQRCQYVANPGHDYLYIME